ncbi:MAG: DUF3891 family protein [Candidatus Dadabacteria bacterium]|nr:DUF3891 family protein [Candidatus Dadabacteria bacterium]NIQ16275.1 DUF3891 family protein [Candidatus Dadabacteria bacterium]
MIRRETDNGWLLINQYDHSVLAYDIMKNWGNDQFADIIPQNEVLLAIKEHDCGWKKWDSRAWLNISNRFPKNFMEMYTNDQYKIWSESFEMHSGKNPYASALIALHFLKFNNQTLIKNPDNRTSLILKNKINWFVSKMLDINFTSEEINGLLPSDVGVNLKFLQFGDIISLTLCHGWASTRIEEVPVNYHGKEVIVDLISEDGLNFKVKPNPFSKDKLYFEISAKELNEKEFNTQEKLDEAFSNSKEVRLSFSISK